ncbi:hypothetical protein ACFXB3_23060 [Streptomyces sp. NPDC059447]|uniref:hypothetical protein n=1 Tax=Streptomyces sp. NPDC059447 TaxID=3346834 RepID=UPI0036892F29
MPENPEPRRLTRTELADTHGIPAKTLERWWSDRENNGHPPAERQGRTLTWDSAEWEAWHRHRQDTVGPAEFAKILGHKDNSWVTKAAAAPPPGFPEPVEWGDTVNRRRPKWRRTDAQTFADNRTRNSPPPGAGRPTGSRAGTAYEGDERLTAAIKSLTDHPDDRPARHIERLHQLHPGTSASGWTKILKAARDQQTP